MEKEYLFVYGTLKRGFENPFARMLPQYSSWVGEATMPGRLFQVSWYPGALYEPESSCLVHGEVFHLLNPGLLLKELDLYEEVLPVAADSLYLRREVPVMLANQIELNCWTYLYNQPVRELWPISNGCFAG
ncbi:gamma-glutamylcyclotransferase family protein [Telluribacter sp.]|jgi:gamma-glutamylcyclotransferase (GGCT)/AIG2-like uncharacterized protein YtfP|uniref:gamma-glutamylcyclotransferase family protein n=1 Tax=Telluribacter sp. TaxID=1978767 RepID=UPI002E100C4D|nr:gamma-glutamylcyclotransferase family protein [Telluribacter sp.]